MRPSPYHFFPLAGPFVLGLVLLVALVIVLIEVHALTYAYEKMGLDRRYVFAILLLSLLGSYINIPIAQLPPERVLSNREVLFFRAAGSR